MRHTNRLSWKSVLLIALLVVLGSFAELRVNANSGKPVFDSHASGFLTAAQEGSGLGGGGGTGFAMTTGQSHKAGFFDYVFGWLVGKVLDSLSNMPVNQDSCGGKACSGGGGGGW
jgi:hypothetical protein